MTTNITPDKAQELLNTARQEAGDGQRPVTVAAKYAPLAEAAYALEQTVANLHYEYAVQVQAEPGGMWHTVTLWQADPRPVLPEGRELEPNERIVRRLMADPEVVE